MRPGAGVAVILFATAGAAGVADAQAFNISFGSGEAPSSTYAAAGLAGTWNKIAGTAGPTYSLVDIGGNASGVTISQGPITTILHGSDPSVSGDDAKLLNEGLIDFDPVNEACISIMGLPEGRYEMLMYAWMPSAPDVLSRTRQDEFPTTVNVGGAWPGMHQEGVTYARYVLDVDSSGHIGSHSGIVPGADASKGAAFNGIQLAPCVAGDAGDCTVGAGVSGGGGGGGGGGGSDGGGSDGGGGGGGGGGGDGGGGGGGGNGNSGDGVSGGGCNAAGDPGSLAVVLGVGLVVVRRRPARRRGA